MKLIKIAVLFSGNPYNRKGLINAVLNRAKYLQAFGEYDIDVYCIATYYNWMTRKLFRHFPKLDKASTMKMDGLTINIIWKSFSIIDFISKRCFRFQPLTNKFIKHIAKDLQGYDIISVHSNVTGRIAMTAKNTYGIPYCITWHGSDIHTMPFRSPYTFNTTKKLILHANCNFFVSNALMQCSNRITPYGTKKILYNGVSEKFFQYNEGVRKKTKYHLGASEQQKIVAFVGNLITIKNVELLPDIFYSIAHKYDGDLIFWIIGDGDLRQKIETQFKSMPKISCIFWGNQPTELMPDYMNCIDVLVLPSKNEGLPLVTIEAIKCGANVVGANVGGIKEAIGAENVFNLGDDFIDALSNRVVFMLNNHITQFIPMELNWSNTAKIENDCYHSILDIK